MNAILFEMLRHAYDASNFIENEKTRIKHANLISLYDSLANNGLMHFINLYGAIRVVKMLISFDCNEIMRKWNYDRFVGRNELWSDKLQSGFVVFAILVSNCKIQRLYILEVYRNYKCIVYILQHLDFKLFVVTE